MLIGFELQNFRSFLGAQKITFAASSGREHASTHSIRTSIRIVPRVCKTALLLGPNAAGKSNLIAGLSTLRNLVLKSTAFSVSDLADRYSPFRFKAASGAPTVFEIDFLIDDVRYRYSVAFDAQRVRAESLFVSRTGKWQRWFARHYDAGRQKEVWAPFSPFLNGTREVWRKATRPTALFLTTAALLNAKQLAPLLHWFEHCLDVVTPVALSDADRLATFVHNAGHKKQIVAWLRSVGLPIYDVRLTEQRHSLAEGPRTRFIATREADGQRMIEFLHTPPGVTPVWFTPEYEASGIRRLFSVFGHIVAAIEHGRLLVIDEFDVGVHPLLARHLLELISSPAAPPNRAQVLFTTHNTSLMDLDLLRRDEIWLIELDDEYASALAPLAHSSPRKHEHIAKGYLRGRYGATPRIDPMS